MGALYDNVRLIAFNSAPPSAVSGANILVNGSFEATPVGGGPVGRLRFDSRLDRRVRRNDRALEQS
jgi:hypothetical protein